MQEVVVKITKDGNITMEANEFHGTTCKKTLDNLVKNIGTEDNQFKAKPEYYEENNESISVWG